MSHACHVTPFPQDFETASRGSFSLSPSLLSRVNQSIQFIDPCITFCFTDNRAYNK
ncbi:unnamed protein product [Penicillium camemberti]|uniref:Str. FM013 n=1 Tax=Penicillium camemberti (strain FM 013) TaxID=1429867 RepID=A0A0G4P672_PENC3|nr:unnamed protein product [Penicillium camemberti]